MRRRERRKAVAKPHREAFRCGGVAHSGSGRASALRAKSCRMTSTDVRPNGDNNRLSARREGQLSCPLRHQACECGASATSSDGVGWGSTERAILAQPCRFCRLASGGVGLSLGFASRRSPVRSRYAPSKKPSLTSAFHRVAPQPDVGDGRGGRRGTQLRRTRRPRGLAFR